MLDLYVAEQQTLVHQVARVVVQRDFARAHEQAVLEIANRERIERETSQQASAHLADKQLAVNPTAELRLDQAADLLASGIGANTNANGHRRHEDNREEGDCTDENNEVPAAHWS